MVAKAKFGPIGDILSAQTAFIQASDALDVAGQLAVESKDIEGLNTVASLYIELASRLMDASGQEDEEEEVDEEALARKIPLGFYPTLVIPVEEPTEQEIVSE